MNVVAKTHNRRRCFAQDTTTTTISPTNIEFEFRTSQSGARPGEFKPPHEDAHAPHSPSIAFAPTDWMRIRMDDLNCWPISVRGAWRREWMLRERVRARAWDEPRERRETVSPEKVSSPSARLQNATVTKPGHLCAGHPRVGTGGNVNFFWRERINSRARIQIWCTRGLGWTVGVWGGGGVAQVRGGDGAVWW